MKKFLATGLAFVCIFTMVFFKVPTSVVRAADTGGIVVTNYWTSPDHKNNTIYKGTKFELNIDFVNRTGKDIKDVYVDLDPGANSSFEIIDKGSTQYVGNVNADKPFPPVSFKLNYNGGTNKRIPITIGYTDAGVVKTSSTSISINAIEPGAFVPLPTPDSTKYRPKLSLANIVMPEINAGDVVTLNVPVKNTSSYEAKDISITPVIEGNSAIIYDDVNITKDVSSIQSAATEVVKFRFKVLQSAIEKSYPVKLNFEYSNIYGDSFTSVANFNLKVTNSPSSGVVITGVTTEEVIRPLDKENVNITIKNNGSLQAKNVKVSLTGMKEDGIVVAGGTNTKVIGSLQGGQEMTTAFTVSAAKKAEDGNYPITAKVTYTDANEKELSDDQIFYIKVQKTAANEKLSISKVVADGDGIAPGEKTNLTIGVANTSGAVYKNVKVLLSGLKEDGIVTASGTNTKTIAAINAGAEGQAVFQIAASKKADTGSYPITVKVMCNDISDKDASDEQVYYVNVQKTAANDKIYISKVIMNPDTIKAGAKTVARVYIKNSGALKVKNVKVAVQGSKDDTFSVAGNTNSQFINNLNGSEEAYVDFTLLASKKLDSGRYGLTAKLTYEDASGKDYADENVFFATINNGDNNDASIVIDDVVAPTTTMLPNQEFVVSFNVNNTGETAANNIKVNLTPDPLLIPRTPTVKVIKSLAPNKKQKLTFVFTSPKEISPKNYPIQINAEYEIMQAGQKVKQTASQYVGVYIDKPGSNKKTVPKIILDRYNIDPAIVEAGSNFKLNLSFLNTNSSKAVQNVKIYLTANETTTTSTNEVTGNIFTPVNGSNTFFIDSISPKGRIERQLELYAIIDAKPKTYTVTANFEYEDANGTEYKATELIGIPVRQQAKVETADLSLPTEAYVGQPLTVGMDFYNTGKTMLRNFMVKAEGNFDVQSPNYFVGNFDTGSQDHYEATIMPKAVGPMKGAVVISYEDSSGQKQTIRKEININATEMPPPPPTDPNAQVNPEGQDEGFFKKLIKNKIVWGVVGVSAVGAVTFFVMKRKRRKNEEMFLDE